MSHDEMILNRLTKLKALIDKNIDPFSKKRFDVTHKVSDIIEKFQNLSPHQNTGEIVSIAGRIMSIRDAGKLIFADLIEITGKIQIVFNMKELDTFDIFKNYLDLGDIIGVQGEIFTTKKGELSILIKKAEILSKALRPFPKLWTGLKDTETRYRQRYLDFILNEEVRQHFLLIFKCQQFIRNYLNERDFVEINTPVLQPLYGGAFANPFVTFHKELSEDMYLRIAPELYLKRLIVGGFPKVYEFASCFRNESIDTTHNPEFIQIEIYMAYADARAVMELTENTFSHILTNLTRSEEFEYRGNKINFSLPWKRTSMNDAIEEYGGPSLTSMSNNEIIQLALELTPQKQEFDMVGDAIEALFDHYVKPNLIQPTFITDFPADISPLAKLVAPDSKFADRFEFYIGAMECGNGFSELNNPLQQYKRFSEQEEIRKAIKKEDLEYQPMDRDYIRALEYGMPPAGGVGWGLGRLFMLLTNNESLREVIAFPVLRKEKDVIIKTVAELEPESLKWYK